jgi:hypothetical protein
MIQAHFDIQIIQTDDVTAAQLMVPEGMLSATASAKRHPKDEPDEQIGITLALGRIFAEMSENYLATAQAMIDYTEPTLIIATQEEADQVLQEWFMGLGVPESELG